MVICRAINGVGICRLPMHGQYCCGRSDHVDQRMYYYSLTLNCISLVAALQVAPASGKASGKAEAEWAEEGDAGTAWSDPSPSQAAVVQVVCSRSSTEYSAYACTNTPRSVTPLACSWFSRMLCWLSPHLNCNVCCRLVMCLALLLTACACSCLGVSIK
jgi:hypothetical protein